MTIAGIPALEPGPEPRVTASSPAARAATLVELVEATWTGVPATHVLAVLAEAVRALRADAAALFVVDRDASALVGRASFRLPVNDVRVRLDEGIVGRIADSAGALAIADTAAMTPYVPEKSDHHRAPLARLASVLGAPLLRRGQLVGIFYLGSSEAREFEPTEVALMDTLALRLAAEVDALLLLDENERWLLRAAAERRPPPSESALRKIVHDLRNPLSGITLAAQLLSRSAEPEQLEVVAAMESACRRMQKLVDGLADVASSEKDRHTLARCDLASIAREAFTAWGGLCDEAVPVEANLPALPVLGRCDRERVSELFTRLLAEAAAIAHGDSSILVAARHDVRHFHFDVTVRGAPAVGDGAAPVRSKLWRARGIAQAHGGDVTVHRESTSLRFAATIAVPAPTTSSR